MLRSWIAIVPFMVSQAFGQAIIHVPADAPTIQIAIEQAQPFDTIIVAPGTYYETISFLGKAITVRSSRGQEVTTISAVGLGGSVVMCINYEGSDTVLDGFRIMGGTGRYLSGANPGYCGGGMCNDHSSPTVINCTFSGNAAMYGGGMYNLNSDPTVTNCAFTQNSATYYFGGGIFNDFSSPTIINCTFNGNAASSGGGMRNFHSSPSVSNCAFTDNTASTGGGITNVESSPTVTNCTFIGNEVFTGGGGMTNSSSSPTVTSCLFSGNMAFGNGSPRGGGMYNVNSDPTLTNCTFRRNRVYDYGGGIYNTGSNLTVDNCTFQGNTAWRGGGMYNSEGGPEVSNCTFSGNSAYLGGGIFNTGSNLVVTNCTFCGNSSYRGGGIDGGGHDLLANCIFWRDSAQEIVSTTPPTIRFSVVHAGLPLNAIDSGGNMALDPMFIRLPNPGPDGTWGGSDDDYGDLRLRRGSPCVNAGDPGFIAQTGETDLDGHARLLCGRVDMGAYEFGIGDNECDDDVDLGDFDAWDTCFTGLDGDAYGDGCEAFDFDLDGDVDLLDHAAFQLSFTGPL